MKGVIVSKTTQERNEACSMCGEAISAMRLECIPTAKTCSHRCSEARQRMLRKASLVRHRTRLREKKSQKVLDRDF